MTLITELPLVTAEAFQIVKQDMRANRNYVKNTLNELLDESKDYSNIVIGNLIEDWSRKTSNPEVATYIGVLVYNALNAAGDLPNVGADNPLIPEIIKGLADEFHDPMEAMYSGFLVYATLEKQTEINRKLI